MGVVVVVVVVVELSGRLTLANLTILPPFFSSSFSKFRPVLLLSCMRLSEEMETALLAYPFL